MLHISVIIWESFIKLRSQRGRTLGSVWISLRSWCKFKWFSLDHHWNGDIIVVGWVFDLISILLSDWFKSVITNDFSEGLEGHTINNIKGIGRWNLQGKSSLLIDWYRHQLWVSVINFSIGLEGGKTIAEMDVGSTTGFNLRHGLHNKVGCSLVLRLDSRGFRYHGSCQGKLNNTSHFKIIILL